MQYQPPQGQFQQPYTPHPNYQPPYQPDVAPPQQPPFTPYPQPGQFQQPPKPPRRAWYQRLYAWCKRHPIISISLVLVFLLIGSLNALVSGNGTPSSSPVIQPTQAVQSVSVTVVPTHPPKPTPTPKPAPTVSPQEVEATYKASTTSTTVEDVDKQGNAYNGKNVHFTAKIIGFVKDNSGNTVGANVDAPDSFSMSVVQVAFPTSTDLSQVNQDDTVEIWGLDGGVSSGTNAYGATVQEVVVAALYMTDQTTGYQSHD